MDLGTSLCVSAAAVSVLTYVFWANAAKRAEKRVPVRVVSQREAMRRQLAEELRRRG